MSAKKIPYQLLIVGLGRVGLKHLQAVKDNKTLFNVAALVDTNAGKASEVWKKASMHQAFPPLYSSLDQLPGDLKIDVAAICTPSGTHFALAKTLIEKGIHCLIEKPMTLDYREACQLKLLAEEHQVKIALGYIYRFFPLVDVIQEEVAQGKYGRVLSGAVEVYWGHDQAYYDASPWRGTWAQDGGVLMNQCVHALDLMNWIMGARISSAQAMIAQQTHFMEAEDFGLVNYHLENDSFLHLTGTTTASKHRQRAEFSLICEKVELRCGLHKKKPYYKLYNENGRNISWIYIRKMLKSMWQRGFTQGLKELLNPHSGIYRDWADAISNNRDPRAGVDAGINSLAAILCAYASARAEGLVKACPQEQFKLADMQNYFAHDV